MKLIFKDGQELVITRANDTYSYEGYKDGLGNYLWEYPERLYWNEN